MPAQKFKFGKAKKMKIDETQYIVIKISGKPPTKIVRQLKLDFNEAVQKNLNVLTVQPE